MYTRDGGLILKDGVVLSTVEIVDLLNKLQKVNDKWYALDAEIAEYYQEDYDDDSDEFGDGLIGIGETAAGHFGYL